MITASLVESVYVTLGPTLALAKEAGARCLDRAFMYASMACR
jgi:hypothetical protein